MLEIKDLSLSFDGHMIINHQSISFPQNGFIAIVGESGCGKTSFLYCLSGMNDEVNDALYFYGQPIGKDYLKSHISFIKQNNDLINALTVEENILLGCVEASQAYSQNRFKHIISQLEIEHLLKKRPLQLSVGQRKRVSIARAILKNTDIVLCDEPTGALHQEQAHEVMKQLKELSKQRLVIIVTHQKALADTYCDDSITLSHGKFSHSPSALKETTPLISQRTKKYRHIRYSMKQILYQKKRLFSIFLFQSITIASFLSIISGVQGFQKSLDEAFHSAPLKNCINIRNYDYSTITSEIGRPALMLDLGTLYLNQEIQVVDCYVIPQNTSHLILSSGRLPLNNNEIVVSKAYSNQIKDQKLYMSLGDQTELNVVGVLKDNVFHESFILFSESYYQNHPDYYSLYERIVESQNVKEDIKTLSKEYNVTQDDMTKKESYETLIKMLYGVSTVFIGISFISSQILLLLVLSSLYIERKRDYALLLSFGCSHNLLKRESLLENTILGIVMTMSGVIVYIALFFTINDLYHIDHTFYFSFVIPKIIITGDVFVYIFIFYCIMTCLCGLIPFKKIDYKEVISLLREE